MTIPSEEGSTFICPECGSRKAKNTLYVSTVYAPDKPWSAVLQIITCAVCSSQIPAHLGERWDGTSEAAAREEWVAIYRDTQPPPEE